LKGFAMSSQNHFVVGSVQIPTAGVNPANEVFARSSYPALRRLYCHVEGDALFLSGRVPSYYVKQMAYSAAKRIEGIVKIVDRTEVWPIHKSGQ
jgi:hypothetical protein